MVGRVRAFDWSATPLGPLAAWPVSLRTAVAALLHSRHPMFIWWGPELIQIYNDAYVPSFGIGKHPKSLGQRGRECWPEMWSVIGPQIDDVMRCGVATWQEDALIPIFRNGAVQDAYWTYGYSPLFDEAGDIIGTLVICTETTGRVLAQAALEQQRSRLFEFFRQVPAGVCIVRGEDLIYEFANEQYERLVGKNSLAGQSLMTVIPEVAGQGFDVLLRNVMQSGVPIAGHETLLRQDRGKRGVFADYYYTFSYSPFHDSQGAISGVIALVLDVTEQVVERRAAEELARRLRESEDKFQVMAESIPQLAWSARPDGHIDWFNRRWYTYTGSDPDLMEGHGWKSVLDPDLLEEAMANWTIALRTGDPFDMQFPLRRHDGVFRWHLTRALPVRDDSGAILRWFGTNTDVHDARQAELERSALLASEQTARQAAEVANRAKDDFLTIASHELRTPLNAILGWAQLLRADALEASEQARATESIERNARAQVRLIEDILDGSRILTGQLKLESRPLDMASVVSSAIDSIRSAAQAKGIELAVSLESGEKGVVGDPDRLQQVVWNLLNNAVKFTPQSGTVGVSLARAERAVVLTVADTGQGIAADFLPFVFERFRQAEGGTTRRSGGLGLGLALVRHLVEAHGGEVQVESEGRGRGASFTVTLPLRAESTDAVLDGPASSVQVNAGGAGCPPPTQLSGVSALVVDDDEDARNLVATILRGHGARVTIAVHAQMALDLLTDNSFDLLVCDIGMPDMDGYELMRRIRALGDPSRSEIEAIALTAYARDEDQQLAIRAGFRLRIVKPVDPDELIQVIVGLSKPDAVEPPGGATSDRP